MSTFFDQFADGQVRPERHPSPQGADAGGDLLALAASFRLIQGRDGHLAGEDRLHMGVHGETRGLDSLLHTFKNGVFSAKHHRATNPPLLSVHPPDAAVDRIIMREHMGHIAHFHTAGNPGRHELDDTQEMNYRGIARAIADAGFTGYVAHEYTPLKNALVSLAEAIQIFTV